MKVDDIRIGKSELSDRVYAGKLNKDKSRWLQKKDVTNDFIHAVIRRWLGTREVIKASGDLYEISVKKKRRRENVKRLI